MPSNLTGVVGSDGLVPVYDPNGLWRIWSINEIFQSASPGLNKFVPKVQDYVIDPATFTTWIVDDLDTTTLIPTLREIRPANMSYSLAQSDILFGVGPGSQAQTMRVYLDTSTLPYTMAVDARLRVGGSMVSYAKVYKGSVVDGIGEVISKVYDSSGLFVSENVALEVVQIDSHINYSWKNVPPFKCTKDLVDGEVVTIVFFSDQGIMVSKSELLVEKSSFIRGVNSSTKYVTSINLLTAFLSPTQDMTIEYPLNVPINALNLMGRVNYSDGSFIDLPVDGTKFRMFGLEQYVSSIVGQKLDLVLSYALSANETAYAGVGVQGNYVTVPYSLMTVNPNNSYTVKLFGYPFWVDSSTGYQMRWWLLNLDRNVFFEVTSHVLFNSNTGPYDPKGYGYMQRKSVSINLRDVSGVFKAFVHTQMVEIVLNGPPTTDSTAWTVSHESNVSRPMYGLEIFAKKKSNTSMNLGSGITVFNDWLTRVYYNTFPLVNPNTEIGPLTPTHFSVTHGGASVEFPISNWNVDLTTAGPVVADKTVSVRFFKRTSSGDLHLAISAMIIRP